ncbi:MAG: hypothetical protein KAG04_00105 [Mycoplasmataceae bacterium]|nr:hypothetical protein [Mycoplasmataceae bacterium]
MKFNTTYSSKQSTLETLRDLSEIKKLVLDFMNSKYKFISVEPPLFFEEGSDHLIDVKQVTRKVSFDFGEEYRTGVIALSHTNWMRNIISGNDFKLNQGIYANASFIWRDLEETPTTSTAKTELSFQFVVNDSSQSALNELTQDVYEFIVKLADKYAKKYDFRNIYPYFAEYVSAQQLENSMPNNTFKTRETEFVNDKNAFIFRNPGDKLFSGDVHTFIHPSLYELKKYNQILLKDRVNFDVLKVVSIGVIATGKELQEQLNKNNLKNYFESKFFIKQMKEKRKIIEIKFNVPRLAMAVLWKGHIGEVQSGVVTAETKSIKNRYGVKII